MLRDTNFISRRSGKKKTERIPRIKHDLNIRFNRLQLSWFLSYLLPSILFKKTTTVQNPLKIFRRRTSSTTGSEVCSVFYRGGSRGGVEGVATPPPLSSIFLLFCLILPKNNRIKLIFTKLFHFHHTIGVKGYYKSVQPPFRNSWIRPCFSCIN